MPVYIFHWKKLYRSDFNEIPNKETMTGSVISFLHLVLS